MNKTTEPAALAGIEPVAWMAWDDAHSRNVFATGEVEKARTIGYNWTPLYSAATVERLVQELDELKRATITHDEWYAKCNELAAMTQERDWLNHKSKCLEMERASQERYLAASQAREQQLREALSTCQCYSNKQIAAALSLPQDDTALKAWGAKLLREIADGCRDGIDRAWITSKADELMEEKGNG